jgi:hypothetical protein
MRSLKDGRSYTKDIKTVVSLNANTIKQLIESKCNVELIAFKENTYFDSSYSDNQKSLTYSGIFKVNNLEIGVYRKILPLWKDDFDVTNQNDLLELQNYLKNFYGNTFELKSVRFD